jgi:phosphate-selective porin
MKDRFTNPIHGSIMKSIRMNAIAPILILSWAFAAGQTAPAPDQQAATGQPAVPAGGGGPLVGLTGKGGGVFIKSEDGRGVVRLMGYAQPSFMATAESNKQAFKVPSFYVRRARADFKAEYDSLYTLFFEYDGGPAAGTALVEGYAQASLVRDYLNFRMGKYIQPFSAENLRSSRALATVERFQALNAVIGAGNYDAQIGAMLFGALNPAKTAKYFLSVVNGNSNASSGGNVKDNNSDKDFIARVEFSPSKALRVGVAGDIDKQPGQTLALKSYSGATFDTVRVYGARTGLDVDLHSQIGNLGMEAEWLWAGFADTNAALHGGYVQAGYWVKGSEAEGGIEPLLRLEYSTLSADAAPSEVNGATMMAATLGVNWWMNAWTRWQLNLIGETTSKKGNAAYAGSDDGRFLPTLLAEFQIKF